MTKLSEKSRAVIQRFNVHKKRCLQIEKGLGKVAAYHYHLRHKADSGSVRAKGEFENLIANN